METAQFTKQLIDFQKVLFENSFNAVTVMQNHSENIINGFLKQFPWVTEENKKPFNDSVAYLKKTRTEYKNNIDQGFSKLEEMICTKQGKTVQKQTAKVDEKEAKETADSQLAPVAPKIKQATRG